MRTVDEIVMMAHPDAIYRAASEVEQWPAFLPHYRWVTIVAEGHDGRTVEMAARRGWIPVCWISEQWCDPFRRRVQYRHIGGVTRGMRVIWAIEPVERGVRVSIVHDLALEAPIVRTWLGQWIVGHFFVHYIAGRTLQGMKRHLEEGTCIEPSSPASDR